MSEKKYSKSKNGFKSVSDNSQTGATKMEQSTVLLILVNGSTSEKLTDRKIRNLAGE